MTTTSISPAISQVPFVDLARHNLAIADELRAAFDRVLEDGGFVLGDEVDAFEAEFAEYCGVRHCVGVGSGTAALTLALLAAGVQSGDEVIVPAHTYIASALGVLHAGAIPRFCDVDDKTGLIDLRSAAEVLSTRTVAVIPVHLYGQVCDMEAVELFARRHGLLVVEDAAQAHGAKWENARAGSLGHVGAFSFYPSKNLGALGDGGAICTDDDAIAERSRRLRNLGQRRKGEHVEAGFNERLDGVQAAMLRIKLRGLDSGNAARRERADHYREALPDGCRPLGEDPRSECVYHLFPVRVADRDELAARLERMGVRTGVHYWPAVHRQPPFAAHGPRDRNGHGPTYLGTAVRWSEEELSLPMFAELTPAEVTRVTEAIEEALEEARR
ncbi:MAG TPA: DegT/DnrJ/EryC1/StrS family aminotransferase [Solirubrobacterales bacterium]